MDKKTDISPPAFPVTAGQIVYSHGMSLRDYFAGQALAGLCANSDGWMEENQIARHAYRYADAMLAARSSAHGDPS